jgi:hypothetical protein
MKRRSRQPHTSRFWRRNSARERFVLVSGMLVGLVAVGAAWWQQREASRAADRESVALSAPAAPDSPLPLRGSRGLTNLRLLVADAPAPFILNVERSQVERVTGLPTEGERGVSVLPLGEHALVLSQRLCARCSPVSGLFLLRHGSTVATPVGRALQAVPSRDGESAWLLRRLGATQCTIGNIGLDARPRGSARRVPCRTGLVAELPAGLLLEETGPLGRDTHSALLTPGGRVIRLPYQQAHPVAGNLVVTGARSRSPLLLRDVRTGAISTLHWPSRPGYGLHEATGDPSRRLAIVEFAKYSPEHRLDMWLLDTLTRRWQHLPGMPAKLSPKATDAKWTADGGVVIFSGDMIFVWRPNEPRLATHRVKPPKQPGIQFVIS